MMDTSLRFDCSAIQTLHNMHAKRVIFTKYSVAKVQMHHMTFQYRFKNSIRHDSGYLFRCNEKNKTEILKLMRKNKSQLSHLGQLKSSCGVVNIVSYGCSIAQSLHSVHPLACVY